MKNFKKFLESKLISEGNYKFKDDNNYIDKSLMAKVSIHPEFNKFAETYRNAVISKRRKLVLDWIEKVIEKRYVVDDKLGLIVDIKRYIDQTTDWQKYTDKT